MTFSLKSPIVASRYINNRTNRTSSKSELAAHVCVCALTRKASSSHNCTGDDDGQEDKTVGRNGVERKADQTHGLLRCDAGGWKEFRACYPGQMTVASRRWHDDDDDAELNPRVWNGTVLEGGMKKTVTALLKVR